MDDTKVLPTLGLSDIDENCLSSYNLCVRMCVHACILCVIFIQVLQAICKALDDPKRAVRQEAVRCRRAWLVL